MKLALTGNCTVGALGCIIVNLFPSGFICDNNCAECQRGGLLLRSNEVLLHYDFINSTIFISLHNDRLANTIQAICPNLYMIVGLANYI